MEQRGHHRQAQVFKQYAPPSSSLVPSILLPDPRSLLFQTGKWRPDPPALGLTS